MLKQQEEWEKKHPKPQFAEPLHSQMMRHSQAGEALQSDDLQVAAYRTNVRRESYSWYSEMIDPSSDSPLGKYLRKYEANVKYPPDRLLVLLGRSRLNILQQYHTFVATEIVANYFGQLGPLLGEEP